MTSIKLSPFAAANMNSMSYDQKRSVADALFKLQLNGINIKSPETTRLPSEQGYLIKTRSGIRLTVIQEKNGDILVDDVFIK